MFQKYFSLACSLLCFITLTTAHAQGEKQNDRQLLVFWQNENVVGNGMHAPYATFVITNESGDKIAEGTTDARGSFTFRLPKGTIPNDSSQLLTATFADQFSRTITVNGKPDTLQALLPPGGQATGQTDAFATITLRDAEGKVLSRTTADENGEYAITNAPSNSTVTITSGDQEATVPFFAGNIEPVYLQEDENTEASEPNSPETTPETPEEKNIFLMTFLTIVIVGGIAGGGYLAWQRRRNSL